MLVPGTRKELTVVLVVIDAIRVAADVWDQARLPRRSRTKDRNVLNVSVGFCLRRILFQMF